MLGLGTVRKLAKHAQHVNLKDIRDLVKKEESTLSNGDWNEWVKFSGDFQTLIARTSLLIRMYESPTHKCSLRSTHAD